MIISNHAKKRLNRRNISLEAREIDKLKYMLQIAEKKGSRESLILLEDKAFLFNVKENRLITVFGKEHLKENIVTNLDSVVFA